MKNIIKYGILVFTILLVSGCSSPSVPKVKTSTAFQFDKVNLNFSQSVQTDIEYHSGEEIEQMFNNKLQTLLKENNLLSQQSDMNTLEVDITYTRRLVGDQLAPTDSLGYPDFKYTINIKDKEKLLTRTVRNDYVLDKGFAFNLRIIAGTLRDKKYEVGFVDIIANEIFEDIKSLHNYQNN